MHKYYLYSIGNLRMKKNFLLLAIIAFMLNSCATVFGGKTNTFVFSETSLPKAEVFIDGEKIGEAPGKIKVAKKKVQHGSTLRIEAEGYKEKEFLILRKQSGIYTVVDLVTGVVPLIVDFSNGNIYRPRPRKFEYELEKQTSPNQAQK